MSDLIDRQAAIDDLKGKDPSQVWDTADVEVWINTLPSAEPEHMHTVMQKIKEKYEKAMNTPCISNPMAWALYQTWKEYDR